MASVVLQKHTQAMQDEQEIMGAIAAVVEGDTYDATSDSATAAKV